MYNIDDITLRLYNQIMETDQQSQPQQNPQQAISATQQSPIDQNKPEKQVQSTDGVQKAPSQSAISESEAEKRLLSLGVILFVVSATISILYLFSASEIFERITSLINF